MSRPKIAFYHGIARSPDDRPPEGYGPTLELFREQMQYLKANWNVVGLRDIAGSLRSGKSLPARSIALTFDDGLAGVMRAWEVLQELQIPAAVFLSTRFIGTKELPWFVYLDDLLAEARARNVAVTIDGARHVPDTPRTWSYCRAKAKRAVLRGNFVEQIELLGRWADEIGWDLRQCRADEPVFMTWQQVRELLAAGLEFGSHTHSHVDLRVLSDADLDEEFRLSVQIMHEEAGLNPVDMVSYPDGRFDERVIQTASRYHQWGFATGRKTSWADGLRIPRVGFRAYSIKQIREVLSWRYPVKRWLRRQVNVLWGRHSEGM